MHITRCLTPRPRNSGEAPCSFTMAPCIVVERLERNQQCSRAPVGEHADVQAQDAECGCHEQQDTYVYKYMYMYDQNPATARHSITTARRPDNIRSSILVRGRSIRLPRKDSHFRHFGGLFVYMCKYIYKSICIVVESLHAFTSVVEHHACAGVYVKKML